MDRCRRGFAGKDEGRNRTDQEINVELTVEKATEKQTEVSVEIAVSDGYSYEDVSTVCKKRWRSI